MLKDDAITSKCFLETWRVWVDLFWSPYIGHVFERIQKWIIAVIRLRVCELTPPLMRLSLGLFHRAFIGGMQKDFNSLQPSYYFRKTLDMKNMILSFKHTPNCVVKSLYVLLNKVIHLTHFFLSFTMFDTPLLTD